MFDGVSAIGGSRRLVVGVACAVLLMAVVEFGCESVGSQKEPAASSPSPSPASDDASAAQAEKPVEEAVQRLQWKINDAIEHVGRDFGAPPLFPESVVQAIADRRVRLAGEYSADDRIIDRNRNMQTYGGRAGVVASEQGGREVESHSFRSCEALFSRIEAASSPRAFGRARWKIEVTPLEIRHDDQTLVRRTCTDRFECRTEADAEQILLDSLVGPILSYRTVDSSMPCDSDAFATPEYHTRDLREGEDASLAALVDEDSLFEALRADSWVREHVSEARLEEAESLEELLELPYLRQLSAYSFYDWDPDRGQVAMRIWKPNTTGKWSGNHSFLGLWVEPKPDFRNDVEAAARAEGFLMTSDQRPVF